MKPEDITIIQKNADTTIYGLTMKSNDKSQSKDIPSLSSEFYLKSQQESDKTFPFYVLSKDYDEKTQAFELFIASEEKFEDASELTLPKGSYAIITIEPKSESLWGLAIGQAKKYFYTQWLPQSKYTALSMEYEYHTEKSIGSDPTIDLCFAIKEKQ